MARSLIPRAERLEGRALLSTMMHETEPNNRVFRADEIEVGDDSTTVVGTTRAGDRDFYSVPISAAGTMTLVFQSRGKGRVALHVEDSAGKSLFDTSVKAGQRSATFNVLFAERLSIRVVGSGPRVPYSFNLSETKAVPVVTPPDGSHNTMATALPIALDDSGMTNFSGTLATTADARFYSFTAPKSGRLTVSADRSPSPVIVNILDASGASKLTVNSDLPNFTTSTNLLAGALYYVKVNPRTTAPASYEVGLTLV